MSDSDLIKSINKNVNILVYICLFIITFCCLMSFFNSLALASSDTLTYEAPTMVCMNGKCKYIDNKEHFSNDELFSYKKQEVANYVSAALLAPSNEFKNATNLFFGKANVYINNNDSLYYRIEIYCNLFVLDGNVYDVAKRGTVDQKYIVYLVNDKTSKKKLIGNLYKDGDGIYKLKAVFKNDKNDKNDKNVIDELVSYNKINIVYSLDNKEQVLLEGFFN
jgi:hypothetical protein